MHRFPFSDTVLRHSSGRLVSRADGLPDGYGKRQWGAVWPDVRRADERASRRRDRDRAGDDDRAGILRREKRREPVGGERRGGALYIAEQPRNPHSGGVLHAHEPHSGADAIPLARLRNYVLDLSWRRHGCRSAVRCRVFSDHELLRLLRLSDARERRPAPERLRNRRVHL